MMTLMTMIIDHQSVLAPLVLLGLFIASLSCPLFKRQPEPTTKEGASAHNATRYNEPID